MSPTPSLDSNVLGPNANPSDPGRGPMIIGILWALTIIASSAVAARLYVRKKIGALGWDDWLMLLALVRSTTWTSCLQIICSDDMSIGIPTYRYRFHHKGILVRPRQARQGPHIQSTHQCPQMGLALDDSGHLRCRPGSCFQRHFPEPSFRR